MAVLTIGVAVQRNLFSVVVLSGIYSFLMATVLVALDAVDVGMTEASVGAGVSTVLLLGALYLCGGAGWFQRIRASTPMMVPRRRSSFGW